MASAHLIVVGKLKDKNLEIIESSYLKRISHPKLNIHEVKAQALVMKECLLRGDFTGLVDSIRASWDSKKQSATSVSNAGIEAVYDAAVGAGALAGKVSGAGGGGFMWFFVAPEKRMAVIRTLSSLGGQTSNCHFTRQGTQSWRVT